MNLIPRIAPQNDNQRRASLKSNLLRRAAEIGGTLFGPIPKGHSRQFFCLDEHTWIWHEEWLDEKRQRHAITTRYDIRPNGILKLQDGQTYQPVSREEADNLCRATQMYVEKVDAEYARILQTA